MGAGKKLDKYRQVVGWEFEKMQFIATDTLPQKYSDLWTPLDLKLDDVAFLQYTSGSTNKPKGVIVSHGNLLHNLEAIHQAFEVTENDTLISWLPPYHDMGFIGCILETVYGNFKTVLMSPLTFLKRPFVWLEAITQFKATASVAPNFAFDLCV